MRPTKNHGISILVRHGLNRRGTEGYGCCWQAGRTRSYPVRMRRHIACPPWLAWAVPGKWKQDGHDSLPDRIRRMLGIPRECEWYVRTPRPATRACQRTFSGGAPQEPHVRACPRRHSTSQVGSGYGLHGLRQREYQANILVFVRAGAGPNMDTQEYRMAALSPEFESAADLRIAIPHTVQNLELKSIRTTGRTAT